MSTEIIIPRKRGQLPTCTCIPRLEQAEKKLRDQDLIIQNLLLQFKDLTEDMKRQENINCIPRLEQAEKKLRDQDLIIQNLPLQFKDLTEDMKRQENINKELVLLGLLEDVKPI
jgi:hypothetical protein